MAGKFTLLPSSLINGDLSSRPPFFSPFDVPITKGPGGSSSMEPIVFKLSRILDMLLLPCRARCGLRDRGAACAQSFCPACPIKHHPCLGISVLELLMAQRSFARLQHRWFLAGFFLHVFNWLAPPGSKRQLPCPVGR